MCMDRPLAYLITFSCYGSHLHGSESGSVDRNHNVVGGRYLAPEPGLQIGEGRGHGGLLFGFIIQNQQAGNGGSKGNRLEQ